ncbi:MAG: NADP oxidoreductase [Meiothermus sp.]
MKVGIIGAGNIGTTAARLFTKAGHEVAISNSRGPDSLRDLTAELGPTVRAMTVWDATRFVEMAMEAIPLGKYVLLPAAELKGKIPISAADYYHQRDGEIDFGGLSQSEFLARHLPGVRLVKAFNTMYFRHLATMGDIRLPLEERIAVYLAGDDAEAKTTVAKLIEEIGFASVDTGSLRESKKQEPGSPIYNQPMRAREARQALAQL